MVELLTPILTLIFSASLKQWKTPDDWKEANVSQIFKKGDKSQPADYRPVSLISVCSIVLEHVMHSHLMNFFEDNQILCDQQQGFRKHRSCESQLLTTVQDLASGIDTSQQINAILLDFSKAFDKVPHQRYLIKLEHYRSGGTTLRQVIMFSPSHIRHATRLSARSPTVPRLHQWPAIQSHRQGSSLCRWLSLVSPHHDGQGCRVSTRWPQQATGLGNRLADAFQPRQMRTYQNYQQA